MKRLLSFMTVLLIIVLLCSCSHSSVPFSPKEQLPDATTAEPISTKSESETTGDPFADICLFDDTDTNVLELFGEPTDYEDSDEFNYEDFSYLGMTGTLAFEFDVDDEDGKNTIEDMIFVYQYPGAASWSHSYMDEVYSPTSEDLRIAQGYWNSIVQHYTELYGEPVYQDSNKTIWSKEDRMGYSEFVLIETGYSEDAFDVYSSITRAR